MEAKRIGNKIVKDGIILHIFSERYPNNYIDWKVDLINEWGLSFVEMGIMMGDKPITWK